MVLIPYASRARASVASVTVHNSHKRQRHTLTPHTTAHTHRLVLVVSTDERERRHRVDEQSTTRSKSCARMAAAPEHNPCSVVNPSSVMSVGPTDNTRRITAISHVAERALTKSSHHSAFFGRFDVAFVALPWLPPPLPSSKICATRMAFCKKDPSCLAFNYNEARMECELLSSKYHGTDVELIHDEG